MEEKEIRRQMESLWKETFGDSSEYVTLVFDNYFTPENVAFHEENGEVVAALVGVPYAFRSGDSSRENLKGLYLCGLATKEHHRRKGLMSHLIDEINSRAKERGFDFTFLIPADEGRRQYYRDRGYHDTFYQLFDHYVKGHQFNADVNLRIEEFPAAALKGDRTKLENLIPFLYRVQNIGIEEKDFYNLQHTEKDWEAVISDWFLSGHKLYLGYVDTEQDEIYGAAFVRKVDEGKSVAIEVKWMAAFPEKNVNSLLKGLAAIYPDCNITVVRDMRRAPDANQLWRPFVANSNSPKAEYEDVSDFEEFYDSGRGSVPLGMIRLLNVASFLAKTAETGNKELEGLTADQLQSLLIRRPSARGRDVLASLLSMPEFSFGMSMMLE